MQTYSYTLRNRTLHEALTQTKLFCLCHGATHNVFPVVDQLNCASQELIAEPANPEAFIGCATYARLTLASASMNKSAWTKLHACGAYSRVSKAQSLKPRFAGAWPRSNGACANRLRNNSSVAPRVPTQLGTNPSSLRAWS